MFHQLITRSISEHICVIDSSGQIVFANQAWQTFAHENGAPDAANWKDCNYLQVCERAAGNGDESANIAFNGIRQVITGKQEDFYLEYPCHSPSTPRWYSMHVTQGDADNRHYYVISHQDITQRKLAEDRANQLARTDTLTGLANRRHFNERFAEEWRRCQREGSELTLALIDIDYFKELNDSQGHQAGDACLEKLGHLLSSLVRRPGDVCGRYGGDEFVLLLTGTAAKEASYLLNDLPLKVRQLSIPNPEAITGPYVTVSIGLASTRTSKKTDDPSSLLAAADHFLYLAKSRGRNGLAWGDAGDASGAGDTEPDAILSATKTG